jgi:hypothetical protein
MTDPTLDVDRHEALWFETTMDGLRPFASAMASSQLVLIGRARLAEQFDAVLHIDRTSALEPLERWAFDETDLPETYPSGI